MFFKSNAYLCSVCFLLAELAGANNWEAFRPGPPTICSHGGEYAYMARTGTVNNVIVEFEGGGCCYSGLTCLGPTYTRTVSVRDELNSLKNSGGIRSQSDPRNPFLGWSHLYIPYCTGDAHMGNKTPGYGVHHAGQVNAKAALEWLKTNVSNNPGKVFVTGGSAGSVASYVWAPKFFDMYPNSEHYHLGDSYAPLFGEAGYNGGLDNWDSLSSYDRRVKGMDIGRWRDYISASNLNATARTYPKAMFASYISNRDPVQTSFYIFEGCGAEKCNWKKAFRNAIALVHNGIKADNLDNYASFVSPSNIHVITESDEMYNVVSENISFVDWLRDLVYGNGNVTREVDCLGDGC